MPTIGERNAKTTNAVPMTMLDRPVLAPAAAPDADSTNVVMELAPMMPPTAAAAESTTRMLWMSSTSPFSSRLEVFSVVDVLLAQGRSLDIVKEARLVDAHTGVRLDLLRAAAAAPLIECIAKAAQPDLPNPRSYACAVAALDAMDDAEAGDALAIGAAALLKVYSFTGFRPSFDACVSCGRRLDVDAARQERSLLAFSAFDGGVLCDSCGRFSDAMRLSAETLGWARFLLMSTFDDIEARHVERRISFDVLHLCQTWTRAHLGGRSKASVASRQAATTSASASTEGSLPPQTFCGTEMMLIAAVSTAGANSSVLSAS